MSIVASSNLTFPSTVRTWWDGSTYKNNSLAQFKLASSLLDKYEFKGNESILDIGCGDGKITLLIGEEKVPHGLVVGMDYSKSMIKTCLESMDPRKNIRFEEGNAETFNLNKSFDLVVSFTALYWVPNQKAVWERIRAHLNIGGKALVSLNPLPRIPEFTQALSEVMKDKRWVNYFIDYQDAPTMPEMTIKQYEDIILSTGLKVGKCIQSYLQFDYESKKAFEGSIKSWLPQVTKVPKEEQDVFVEAFVSKFITHSKQEEMGSIYLKYNNFIVEATRIS